jgi:hypothetical protein
MAWCLFKSRDSYECVTKSFRTESITEYMFTAISTRWEATRRVMGTKLTRLTHKIAMQLHLVAESCTVCSSRSRRPVRKLLDTPSYDHVNEALLLHRWEKCENWQPLNRILINILIFKGLDRFHLRSVVPTGILDSCSALIILISAINFPFLASQKRTLPKLSIIDGNFFFITITFLVWLCFTWHLCHLSSASCFTRFFFPFFFLL